MKSTAAKADRKHSERTYTDQQVRRMVEKQLGPEAVDDIWQDSDRTYTTEEARVAVSAAVKAVRADDESYSVAEVRELLCLRFGPAWNELAVRSEVRNARVGELVGNGDSPYPVKSDEFQSIVKELAKTKQSIEAEEQDDRNNIGLNAPNGRPDLLGTGSDAVWIYCKTVLDPDYPQELKVPASSLKTLFCLRGHWKGNGSGAYPSAAYMAREIDCHERTVRNDLEKLVELDLIRRVPRFKRPDQGYEIQPTLPDDPRVAGIAGKWRKSAQKTRKNRQRRRRKQK